MSNVLAITSGTKLVYPRNAEIPRMLFDYRATIVKREWRGKRRVLTLFLPRVRVTSNEGCRLNVVFPEFKGAIDLACDDAPMEIWNLRKGKAPKRMSVAEW